MTTSLKVDNNDDRTHPPNETTWIHAIQAFLRWAVTPLGFCITIYGLNVVAWGGMLFLLLCNAAPAMCHPSCDDPDSARRVWIEIDSQILNALFCVTGFGLAPWRLRDLYLWCLWRLGRSPRTRHEGLVRLAEVHSKWFCFSGSVEDEDEEKAIAGRAAPATAAATAVTTATGAPRTPTSLWKMDAVVWGNFLNSVFQVCLAVCMWAMDRFHRPSWTTGLFVAVACLVAAGAGVIMWLEKKRVHKASEHPGALLLVPPSAGAATPGNGYMHLNRGGSSS
ncbi:hypothetical protein BO86DRAFT_386533 [Aspergillus japonicus CBS 114.51]|uniref:Uncharacterized protein n=1 Tax=Aspergillus japonicus CBS 114.51 TaxID=1448312 RepID=A0A8T8X9V7_ASPJA|nr:hypothetical protein BO86DRAFT_386533 [Aspergillus japonicus CBS 114.51]RAH84993.1 hypothetical protein BO86DRAFT_386533 [Aspergillus japonicus CBS 114.51]